MFTIEFISNSLSHVCNSKSVSFEFFLLLLSLKQIGRCHFLFFIDLPLNPIEKKTSRRSSMCSIANPTEPIVDRATLIKSAISEPNLKFDGIVFCSFETNEFHKDYRYSYPGH